MAYPTTMSTVASGNMAANTFQLSPVQTLHPRLSKQLISQKHGMGGSSGVQCKLTLTRQQLHQWCVCVCGCVFVVGSAHSDSLVLWNLHWHM